MIPQALSPSLAADDASIVEPTFLVTVPVMSFQLSMYQGAEVIQFVLYAFVHE